MADVQKENGYTEIASSYLEALAGACLSGAEYQVMLVVIRKTWGWKKKQDAISYSKLAELTGLHRDTAIKAVKSLVVKQLLVVVKRLPVLCLELQKDYDRWLVVKRLLDKRPRASSQTSTSASSQTSTHKRKERNSTKEKNLYVRLFDEKFWPVYPKHDAKKDALKAWMAVQPTEELADTIVAAITATKRSGKWTEKKYVPLPATYIRGERWTDEISGNGDGPVRKKVW